MKISTHTKERERGFTLIEALVAISILLFAIAGPLTIASRGVLSSNVARDQTTAFYLAQEAIEYVRNTRDENSLRALSWLTGLSNCVAPSACNIDAKNKTVSVCSGQCATLLLDSNHFYNNLSGNPTLFRRTVSITSLNAVEAAISVTVSWQPSFLAVPRTFTVRENIFNWQ